MRTEAVASMRGSPNPQWDKPSSLGSAGTPGSGLRSLFLLQFCNLSPTALPLLLRDSSTYIRLPLNTLRRMLSISHDLASPLQ